MYEVPPAVTEHFSELEHAFGVQQGRAQDLRLSVEDSVYGLFEHAPASVFERGPQDEERRVICADDRLGGLAGQNRVAGIGLSNDLDALAAFYEAMAVRMGGEIAPTWHEKCGGMAAIYSSVHGGPATSQGEVDRFAAEYTEERVEQLRRIGAPVIFGGRVGAESFFTPQHQACSIVLKDGVPYRLGASEVLPAAYRLDISEYLDGDLGPLADEVAALYGIITDNDHGYGGHVNEASPVHLFLVTDDRGRLSRWSSRLESLLKERLIGHVQLTAGIVPGSLLAQA